MDPPAPPPGQVSLRHLFHFQVHAAEQILASMMAGAPTTAHRGYRCQAGCLTAKVAMGKLLVIIRIMKTLDRLPPHLLDRPSPIAALLARFKPPNRVIPISNFPRSLRPPGFPVANASSREFVGWRYLAEVGRLPAGSTFSISRNCFYVTARSYSYALDLFHVRLAGFRFVGDPTAFTRDFLATYIIKLNRALQEDDWVARVDRILSTLALAARFCSIVKYVIPVATKLGYSVDFHNALLSLTFLGHPFFILMSSPHILIRSRIPLNEKLLNTTIEKCTDEGLFALLVCLQRFVCDRTPPPAPILPTWPPSVFRPRVRESLLKLTASALQNAECGLECVIAGNKLRFRLPWIGAALLRMKDDLSWSLNVPEIPRLDKMPVTVKFRGRRICLNFPELFTRFVGRLLAVFKMNLNVGVCRAADLRVKTDFGKDLAMRIYARFGEKDRTLIGRLAFTEAEQTESTFVVAAPSSRCFPRFIVWRTGNPLLRPLLRQLFEGTSHIDMSMIAEISASAPVLIAISREVLNPIWVVVSGGQPLQFIAIMRRQLLLNFRVNLAGRFVLVTRNAPQYQLVLIVMRATNLLLCREYERRLVCDNMQMPQFLNLIHGCYTILRELAVTDRHGFTTWTFVLERSVVAVECGLRRLNIVAEVGIHGTTLVAFGTGPTVALIHRYLSLNRDGFGCNGQCLDFIISLAPASRSARRDMLRRELPD
jgi:hypothetical protein